MPELPEVETIRSDLQILLQQKITKVYRSDKKFRIESNLDLKILASSSIENIERMARYLLIKNSNQQTLIIHLGMSGRLIVSNDFQQLKHDHFAVAFSNGSWLIFNDPRRFGFIDLVFNKDLKSHKMLSKLSVEPLSTEFDWVFLQDKLSKKNLNIKTAIMDNKIVVGVGNIYASESLFDAGISPLRSSNSLTESELKKIVASIKKVIINAIENRGSSISNYVDAKGVVGNFQNSHMIYGKTNENCFVCNNPVKRIIQNSRASYYCSKCQS